MKLAAAILSLAVGTAVADDMTIRGDSKAAGKLFKEARKLQNDQWYSNGNGYYYQNQDGGGEENNWLGAYSLKLLTCHQGETAYTGEGEPESSSVIFRLCPVENCNPSGPYGCQQGYGDYAVGLQTFMQAFMEEKKEQMEQYQQYGGQYYGYNYGGQGAQNDAYQNQYMYWIMGEEFNVEEYMECREFDMGDGYYNYGGGGNYQNYQGGNYQQNYQGGNYYGGEGMQYFIGPACSADGTSIALAMYMDEDCWYPSSTYFEDISGGASLPFANGGLGSGECMACMGYDYELSRTCQELYESAGNRCEQNMQTYSYYGQNNYGCDYTTQMVNSVLGYQNSGGQGTQKVKETVSEAVEDLERGRLSGKAIALIVVSAVILATLSYCCFCLKWSSAAEREATASDKGVYYSADEETRPIS